MANIQGTVTSSLSVAMQDVTMSFNATPAFHSASLMVSDISSPYSASIILPPNKENDIIIISTLVGAATSDIWAPGCQSIAKVSGSQLNAEWFWRRSSGSQDTQVISSSANNLYGVATIWRGCVTSSTPYLEPVETLGQTFNRIPIAASVTASEDNTTLVSFANIEDDWTLSSFPPDDWSSTFNLSTFTGTDCRLMGMTQDSIPISGSVTEQVDFGLLPTNDYWATLTLLLKSAYVSESYEAYTDSNGIYTQSVTVDSTIKLIPTYSGYEFFLSPGSSKAAVSVEVSSSDITEDFIGVKNFSSGSGVLSNPYTILDHEDMQNVRYRTGSDDVGSYISYQLGSNIDLSPISEWVPINDLTTTYMYCTFRGNDYTISNMNITKLNYPTQRTFGLFGAIKHSSSVYYGGDVTFNSCSIDLTDGVSDNNTRYYGTFLGYNNTAVTYKNIHVKNSTISHNRTGDTGNLQQYMGGIIGRARATISSCSIADSTVYYNTTVATSAVPYAGMISGENGTNVSNYCYVKSCSLFANRNGSHTYMGLLTGGLGPYMQDCYVLNSSVSGAIRVSAAGYSFNASSARIYVAGIQYGNTPIAERYPWQYLSSPTPSKDCYWESGSVVFENTASITGVDSASTAQLKDMRYLSQDSGFNFTSIWGKNDQFQDGYPFLNWEDPTITSSSYGGKVSSSLGIVMENVTMSFFNSGTNDINWTTYTDANGDFTQSIHYGWSGSLAITQSGYEFFPYFNDNLPRYISPNKSDYLEDTNGIKNYSSGSGIKSNSYIILDHEDMNNVRFRSSGSVEYFYKLGADIDLSYFTEWTPIPSFNADDVFYGELDGDNYTISNLNISTSAKLPSTTVDKLFGLFGTWHFKTPGSSSGAININFESCSIDLYNQVGDTAGTVMIGILAGQLYKQYGTNPPARVTNVHVNNCLVRDIRDSAGENVGIRMGGIVGSTSIIGAGQVYGHGFTSCSVQNTTIDCDHVGTSPNIYVGGICGNHGADTPNSRNAISYCFLKNIYVHANRNNGTTEYYSIFADMSNPGGLYLYDCYILSCSVSGSSNVSPFKSLAMSGINGTATRIYVGAIDYGNTPIEKRWPMVPYLAYASDKFNNFVYWESGSTEFVNTASVVGLTASNHTEMLDSASYKTWNFDGIWSQDDSLNYGYPYFGYQSFPTPAIANAGLTLYYDSRLGYLSASNTWTDLSNSGSDATTVYTVPTSSHLYFGTQFGTTSASFTDMAVSQSFGIEIWHAPETSATSASLFSTVSGTFPLLLGYVTESKVYFGYQGNATESFSYLSSSAVIIPNRFNHVVFYISGTKNELWVNGQFHGSSSVVPGSEWAGGTIGIVDTENTNPYKGYIDVFKIWNGPIIDTSTVDSYHSIRDYFPELPPVEFPEVDYGQIEKVTDNVLRWAYTGSTKAYGQWDFDIWTPYDPGYLTFYFVVETDNDIEDFYNTGATPDVNGYFTYVDSWNVTGSPMTAYKMYQEGVSADNFWWSLDLDLIPTQSWNTITIKRNSTDNEYFTSPADWIAWYLNDVLVVTGSRFIYPGGNPGYGGSGSNAWNTTVWTSSKFFIIEIESNGTIFKNLKYDGVLQSLENFQFTSSGDYTFVA